MTTSLLTQMWDKRRSEGVTSSALIAANDAFSSPGIPCPGGQIP